MDCSTPVFSVLHYLPELAQNPCPLSQSYYLATSSSAAPLLFLPSIFPSIRVFSMSWLFASGGQSIGTSASATVLPINMLEPKENKICHCFHFSPSICPEVVLLYLFCWWRIDVTESKFILLITCQANTLRDKVLGQEIANLFRQDGGVVSQRTILPKLQFKLLLY